MTSCNAAYLRRAAVCATRSADGSKAWTGGIGLRRATRMDGHKAVLTLTERLAAIAPLEQRPLGDAATFSAGDTSRAAFAETAGRHSALTEQTAERGLYSILVVKTNAAFPYRSQG